MHMGMTKDLDVRGLSVTVSMYMYTSYKYFQNRNVKLPPKAHTIPAMIAYVWIVTFDCRVAVGNSDASFEKTVMPSNIIKTNYLRKRKNIIKYLVLVDVLLPSSIV